MPRVARIVIPGLYHHVTQRGNNRQDVFTNDDDRRAYLALLRKHADQHRLSILGYCLMANHVHLVAGPEDAAALSRGIGRAHFAYTQWFNEHRGRSGHLWQNRFYSCAVEGARLLAVMRYVERNPVRAAIARHPSDYPWSSASCHIGGDDASHFLDMREWRHVVGDMDWREFTSCAEQSEEMDEMRRRTITGRPFGSNWFLSRMEHKLQRRLRALPVGRPPKPAAGMK